MPFPNILFMLFASTFKATTRFVNMQTFAILTCYFITAQWRFVRWTYGLGSFSFGKTSFVVWHGHVHTLTSIYRKILARVFVSMNN